jgi:tagaturonate epimerase
VDHHEHFPERRRKKMGSRGPQQETDKAFMKLFQPFPVRIDRLYGRSFSSTDGLTHGLVRLPEGRKLVVVGDKGKVLADPFFGKCYHQQSTLKVCDLSPENTACLMSRFPYTKPTSLREHAVTIGTGDRLGVASPGHIRAVRKYPVRPVLAQQSVRENTQTGRNFYSVIQDAAWAVFQEGYREGYGADGDHLKSLAEVINALEAGVSMITLDLSETLNPEASRAPREWVDRKFREDVDQGDSEVLFHLFLDKEFRFQGSRGAFSIQFNAETVKRNTLLFGKALDFTEEVFQTIRSRTGHRPTVDFEVSIDETPFPTSPENHLFFAVAAGHRGIQMDSVAPRFIGEFQKVIDYRGDLKEFRTQFYQHVLIARDHGHYKLSIHSGSDKFSVFPIMGEWAGEGLHLKTAGTSWLEAVRLIALRDPALYRKMHAFALESFKEATKLYHVSTRLDRIPRLDDLADEALPALLNDEDSRQLMHINYGFLLNAKSGAGHPIFRESFFEDLIRYEEEYALLLDTHISKHLECLGIDKGDQG